MGERCFNHDEFGCNKVGCQHRVSWYAIVMTEGVLARRKDAALTHKLRMTRGPTRHTLVLGRRQNGPLAAISKTAIVRLKRAIAFVQIDLISGSALVTWFSLIVASLSGTKPTGPNWNTKCRGRALLVPSCSQTESSGVV